MAVSRLIPRQGDAVTVYGCTNQTMGNYSVSLDSGSISNNNARHDEVNSEVVIFYADNLGPGTHRVEFINNPSSDEGTIATSFLIEKAVVTVVSESSNHHSNLGAIAGGTAGGVVAVIVAVLVAFFYLRRGKHDSSSQHQDIDPETTEVLPYIVEAFDPNTVSQALSHPRLEKYASASSLQGQSILSPGGPNSASSTSAPSTSTLLTPSTFALPNSAAAPDMSTTTIPTLIEFEVEEPPPSYST
ncbi:hypothetical protein HWV62_29899 [Athelia sp. TMB]|nr:hypothetical protein HWV62_29899 [Athelia sp. TMB]